MAIVTEPAGDHPALASGACRLAQDVIVRRFYTDDFLSLTSGLLKALDAANAALLGYNYSDDEQPPQSGVSAGPVAIQAGGVRARRAQAGLTAVLLRPDGAGIYIAQMAPTQAYIVHDGVLSALPEPPGWQPKPGKVAVKLRRVPNPAEVSEEDPDAGSDEFKPGVVPSLPLGSGPSADVDMIYRRVEPGDLVIVVSSSLARHLDRSLAEEIFATGDADFIIDSLYRLAAEEGLAEAHACVLYLGAETTSGVDYELYSPLEPPAPESEQAAWTANGTQVQKPVDERAAAFSNVLRGPKEWFARKKQVPEQEPLPAFDTSDEDRSGAAVAVEQVVEDGPRRSGEELSGEQVPAAQQDDPLMPTQVLLQNSIELPPYLAIDAQLQQRAEAQPTLTGAEELDFDGWEDSPPALAGRAGRFGQPPPAPPWSNGTAALERPSEPAPEQQEMQGRPAGSPRLYPVPTLFDPETEEEEKLLTFAPPARAPENKPPQPGPSLRLQPAVLVERASHGAEWAKRVIASLIPDRQGSAVSSLRSLNRKISISGGLTVGLPILIGVGFLVVAALLAFSVFRGASGAKHNETVQLLAKAKQDETLGNQPSLPPAERLAHLQSALDSTNKALKDDPASAEATLLNGTILNEIDGLQGITRVQTKLLFDLDKVSSNTGDQPATAAASQPATTDAVSASVQQSNMVLLGSDTFVEDAQAGKVYKCNIAAANCSVVLKTGDDVGGQKAGSPIGMTVSADHVFVLDANLVAYVFTADDNSWQAQPLAGADGLSKPIDLASYDGNLYLLGSKPGQISKYAAGHYGDPPADWVKDQATSDQLKSAPAFAIDGLIYALQTDGKVMVMQAGKLDRTLDPKLNTANGSPTKVYTGTDLQNLYILQADSASVSRVSKEGQIQSTLKPADRSISALSAATADEAHGKIYLLSGHKVYEAGLPAGNAPAQAAPSASGQEAQPSARPTAEP